MFELKSGYGSASTEKKPESSRRGLTDKKNPVWGDRMKDGRQSTVAGGDRD